MEKQLAASIPLAVHNGQLKKKDAARAQVVNELQAAEKVLEERRLEVVRLAEQVKKLQEAEKQRLGKVETLRKNRDDLRRQLKESIDANDLIARTAKERELEHEQLVGGLIAEIEHVNELILGT